MKHRGPRLILSANAVSKDPARIADYSCQWCDKPAVAYLFFGPQFCDEHQYIALGQAPR